VNRNGLTRRYWMLNGMSITMICCGRSGSRRVAGRHRPAADCCRVRCAFCSPVGTRLPRRNGDGSRALAVQHETDTLVLRRLRQSWHSLCRGRLPHSPLIHRSYGNFGGPCRLRSHRSRSRQPGACQSRSQTRRHAGSRLSAQALPGTCTPRCTGFSKAVRAESTVPYRVNPQTKVFGGYSGFIDPQRQSTRDVPLARRTGNTYDGTKFLMPIFGAVESSPISGR